MNSVNFIEFLKKAKDSEIKKYIIENGKEGKPFCPIMFIKKENIDDSKNDKR